LKNQITIQFPTEEHAKRFASWLCNAGEQDYYEDMYEQNHRQPIEEVNLCYHGVEDTELALNDAKRYGKFMEDGIVRAIGRENPVW
jgi:hypothetical protein